MSQISTDCACGSKQSFVLCCEKFISGENQASTAEQLMRSRYTAYIQQNSAYLLATWHASTRPNSVQFDPKMHWFDLQIKRVQNGGIAESTGLVEFIARYKINGRAHRLHEASNFIKQEQRWFYLDGEIFSA